MSTTFFIHLSTSGCSYWRGIAEFLRKIAFADQDRADALHLRQDVVERLDAGDIFHLQDDENFALRIERPHVGAVVVFLLRQTPVAHRAVRAVAAQTGRMIVGPVLHARIAAGGDGAVGFINARNMRPHHAIGAGVEHLLGRPLRLLACR